MKSSLVNLRKQLFFLVQADKILCLADNYCIILPFKPMEHKNDK